ncbi:MAG: NADH:flavin oxidoreductase/NADH oxidase [Candidatus Acidiferrales bacterium]
MPHLFDNLEIRDITLRHRIVVSPMCQYSSKDGFADDWHLVHLGSRAVGGASLVFTEATAVLPEARISPQDLGIWKDEHIEPLARITRFIHEQGSIAGIQLAHAGRKASTRRPWEGRGLIPMDQGGWQPVAPSALRFASDYPLPEALNEDGIRRVVRGFRQAARRACEAGFQVLEIHAAHGYLIHEFLSPFSNQRTDGYGGSFENRTRLLREVAEEVRRNWPERLPLFVRISATDWKEGGWDLDQSVELASRLQPLGVDLIDCSSGGNIADVEIPVEPGYQVRFAERIRRDTGILTGAVGLITTPAQVDKIIRESQADIVLLARQMLRDPYWPARIVGELGFAFPWPPQYLRAAPVGTPARTPVDVEELQQSFCEQHAIPAGG